MILHIAQQWLKSLSFLLPKNIASNITSTATHLAQSIGYFMFSFWWLIAIDIFLLSTVGKTISKALTQAVSQQKNLSMGVSFTLSLIGFVTNIIIMLVFIYLTQKKASLSTLQELSTQVLRYIQLILLILAFRFFMIATIIYLGITVIPNIHPIITIGIELIETLLFVAWLNSDRKGLSSIMSIFEQVTNLYFYNLPFFLLTGGLIWASQSAINFWFFDENATAIGFGFNKHILFLFNANEQIFQLSNLNFLFFRYAHFVTYIIFIAGLYQWYINRKSFRYSKYYFSDE